MFERFTDRARRALVLAQEEARLAPRGFLGTEHLLLGLVREGEGVAANALRRLGVSLEEAREHVEAILGRPPGAPGGSSPFTPRAKKVMELALREALQLGHDEIGPEDLLLGMVREGGGVAMAVLAAFEVTGDQVRREVTGLLAEPSPGTILDTERFAPLASARAVALRRARTAGRGAAIRAGVGRAPGACAFCGRLLWDVDRYVATEDVAICADCVALAADAVEHGRAERSGEIPLPPRVYGEPPDHGAVEEVVAAFRATFGPRPAGDEAGEDPLGPYLARLRASRFGVLRPPRVRRVRFGEDDEAEVEVVVRFDPGPVLEVAGRAVRAGGRWEVSWATITEVMTRLGIDGPDEEGTGPRS
ncbi:MAG TPA: Clp protease N-terminal domain-containing protein [Acidimicrobiales bacterium]|nr:Clp protease N-terminal domain-containing protein [Acidimicrobiales bacterium]